MGNKIITEEDFWVCTLGAMPSPIQGTRESLHNFDGKKYITKEDTSTISWIDFGCKKYMLLMAITAALIVVVAVAVGVLTVATGGMGLVMLGLVAGLVGGAVGAVVGGMLCGHKMGPAREWINNKSDFKLQGVEVITGGCEMVCKAGGVIRYAPNIKSWLGALGYASVSYGSELIKCGLWGAAIGTVGTLLGVGAGAVPGTGGLTGTGINFAGRAMTLAKPTVMSVLQNIGLSFGPIGGTARAFSGGENALYTYATDGINKEGEFSSVGGEFLEGALPEYNLYNRIRENGISGLQWTDALFLLYLVNIKADPKGTFRDSQGTLRYARGNQWGKQPGAKAPNNLDPRVSKPANGKPYEDPDSSKPKPARGKPYKSSRPSYKKGQVEEVYEANKKPDGKVYDPVSNQEINWKPGETRDWHMGHKTGYEYRHLYKAYMEGRITKEQFLDYYHDPQYYRPETPKTSSLGIHESDISFYDFDQ